jgi:hypothetical protein
VLTPRSWRRGRDSPLFRRYVSATDRYLKWVFPPSFLGLAVIMLIGTTTGSVPFRSRGFELLSSLVCLSMASWFATNALGLAWGIAIDVVDDASRKRFCDMAFLTLLTLIAGVFLFGAYVSLMAAAAAWGRVA